MKDQKLEMLEATEAAVLRAEAYGFDATADVFRSIRDQLMRELKGRGQVVALAELSALSCENIH